MPQITDVLRHGWLALLCRPVEDAVHPEETTSVHASGPLPYRLLLLGGGAAIGLGVSRHDRALPGHLARHLASITGRGVDLDVVVRLGMTLADARAELDQQDLRTYDGVVLTLGTADALAAVPVDDWRRRLESLLNAVHSRTSPHARVLAVGPHQSSWEPYLHPRVTRLPARLLQHYNEVCRELCWSLPRASYLAPVGKRSSPLTQCSVLDYERVGRAVAGHLAQRLVRRVGPPAPRASVPPARRPELTAAGIDEAVSRILDRTRAAFGVAGATLTVLDSSAATTGRGGPEAPEARLREVAAVAAPARGLAVKNLREDARFRESELARRVAFYAGYPVYGPTGEPAAVLAITDPRPRTFSPLEMAVLRDHALLIQAVLERTPARAGRRSDSEAARAAVSPPPTSLPGLRAEAREERAKGRHADVARADPPHPAGPFRDAGSR